MLATKPTEIDFCYEGNGEVLCRNPKGLTFFLFSPEPVSAKPSTTAAPTQPAPAWKQVDAVMEVEVRRSTEAQPLSELTRAIQQVAAATFTVVEATHEVEVRRPLAAQPLATPQPTPVAAAPRGTGALSDTPLPGKQAPKGWFNKLFSKA
jgi:cell division protein FtsN